MVMVKQTRDRKKCRHKTIWKLRKTILYEPSGKETNFTTFDFIMTCPKCKQLGKSMSCIFHKINRKPREQLPDLQIFQKSIDHEHLSFE